MTTAAQKIESIKRTLRTMNRIAANIITEDYEDLDTLNRAIRDLESDLAELELLTDGTASTEDELIAA
jgi:aconitase B